LRPRLWYVIGPVTGEPEEPEDPDLSRRNIRLGAVVLAVLALAVGISLVRGAPPPEGPKLTGALRQSLEQGGCAVDSRTDKGRAHVPSVTYSVDPPSGGDHDPVPSPAGFYDTSNVPTDGHLVHSLEHGFVIIWYQPAVVTGAPLDGLRALSSRYKWVLVVPRPSSPVPLASTAWHRRLLCPDPAAALAPQGPIGNFVAAFRNQGPEKGFV
jgi:hypothetical protein